MTPHSESPTDDQGKDSEIIWIFIISALKEQYTLQKSVIQEVIGDIVKSSNIQFRETFVRELYKRGSSSVTFDQKVSFKIIFPVLNGTKDFQRHYDEIREMIAVILEKVEKKDIEILVKGGSCILEITLPGEAFINFVVSLAYPSSLDFLWNVSAQVLIQIDNLEPISLDQLSDVSA